MNRTITVIAAASLLAACATVDPVTGERKPSKTLLGGLGGAAAGAAAGTVAGAVTGNPGKGALIGAVVGTIAGLGVGAYMDHQEKALRQRLSGSGVRVMRDGHDIRLIMPNDITFATARADVKPPFFKTLDSVARVLAAYPETEVHVSGHADSRGSEAYNQRLSERRALAVGNYLAAQGVAPGRIIARGFGETRPIASNATPQGRAQNRRVEIRIRPRPASS
ncbi:MAG TPA: OmpA family protein [Thermopetrobacter sp.]|nr:OmpA family protein [Thermopetrobacter sp.]